MSDDQTLKVDFGDGVSALDRTMRAIVMIADGAISHLTEMGWLRKSVNLEINQEDPLPCWVKLRKKRVFEIEYFVGPEGQLKIRGYWLIDVKPPGVIDRFMGHARAT